MNTLEHSDRNITIEVPDHWDELPHSQIRKVLSICLQAAEGLISETKARIRIFYLIAGIRRNWRSVMLEKIMSTEWLIQKNANIYELAYELTEFCFQPKDQSIELTYSTVMNHFPVITVRHWLHTYQLMGPGHQLADCEFGEFRAALEELDEYFSMRKDSASPQDLDIQLSRFIACLYRPSLRAERSNLKADKYERPPFSREHIEDHVHLCRRIDPVIKAAILMWFTYTIHYIQTEDLIISGRELSLRPLFPKPKGKHKPSQKQREGSAAVWSSILYQISKEGPFGKIKETDKAGLYDILLYMYEEHMENVRRKLKNKKHA